MDFKLELQAIGCNIVATIVPENGIVRSDYSITPEIIQDGRIIKQYSHPDQFNVGLDNSFTYTGDNGMYEVWLRYVIGTKVIRIKEPIVLTCNLKDQLEAKELAELNRCCDHEEHEDEFLKILKLKHALKAIDYHIDDKNYKMADCIAKAAQSICDSDTKKKCSSCSSS